jgi:hypothetical protein
MLFQKAMLIVPTQTKAERKKDKDIIHEGEVRRLFEAFNKGFEAFDDNAHCIRQLYDNFQIGDQQF